MLLLSFWTQDYLVLDRTFTLNNYIEAFTQPVFQLLFSRSLMISLTVTFFTVLLAYPMAYFISFYGGNRKALWLFLITIPFWTSYLLRMFLWKVILGYNGVLNSFLLWLELITEPLTFILYNSNAVIIALTHGWAPFAILPIFVSLEKIDRSLLEASRDLGDSPFRQFFKVVLSRDCCVFSPPPPSSSDRASRWFPNWPRKSPWRSANPCSEAFSSPSD